MMIARVRALAAVGMIGLLLAACDLGMDAGERLQRAKQARVAGDLRAALVDLRSLLQKEPDLLEARAELGEVSLEMGDVDSAIRELELARTRGYDPKRIAPPLARAYLAGQKAKEALEMLESLPITGEDAALSTLRGTALLELGRPTEAGEAFSHALRIDPKSVDAALGVASSLTLLEGLPAGLAATDKALAVGPQVPRVRLARGALRIQAGQFQEAEVEFRQAAELAQRQSNSTQVIAALAGLADAQLAQGNAANALTTTAQLIKLAPNNSIARHMHARSLYQNGRLTEARPLLEQNLNFDPDNLQSRLLLGAVTLAIGDVGQAEMYLSSVVAAQPQNMVARQLLGEARLRLRKPDEALNTLMPILDTPEASAHLLALAGRASLAKGSTASGLQYLQRGAEKAPDNIRAQLDLVAGYISGGQLERARALLRSLPADEQGGRRAYLTVLSHLAEGDNKAAIDFVTAAAAAAPNDVSVQDLAGVLFAQVGRYQDSRKHMERVLQLTSGSAAALLKLGRLEMMQGHTAQARDYFTRALEREPGHPDASLALAYLYLGLDQPQQALAVLASSRKVHPKQVEGRVLEAQIRMNAGEVDAAKALAREMVQDAPENPVAQATLGRILAAAGQHREGVQVLQEAIRRLPRSITVRYELASVLASAGQVDEALRAARIALDIEPRHSPTIELLGRLAVKRSDWAEAQRYVNDLSRMAADQSGTHLLAGDVALARKDYQAAVEAYRKAGTLTREPAPASREFEARVRGKLPMPLAPLEQFAAARSEEPRAWLMLAQGQQRLGMNAEAEKSYERVLEQAKDHVMALNNLAWLRHQRGDASALELAKRAYQVAPRNVQIIDTYAWILVQDGRVEQGLKLLAPIANDATSHPEIRLHYAVALARSGKNTEARQIAKEIAAKPGIASDGRLRELIASVEQS